MIDNRYQIGSSIFQLFLCHIMEVRKIAYKMKNYH